MGGKDLNFEDYVERSNTLSSHTDKYELNKYQTHIFRNKKGSIITKDPSVLSQMFRSINNSSKPPLPKRSKKIKRNESELVSLGGASSSHLSFVSKSEGE